MTPTTIQPATVGHTDARFADYLAEAESVCRQIATLDLANYPLYILPQSRLVGLFGQAGNAYAYTTPSLDLYVRDYIDDWRGRGPCVVINDLALDEDCDPEFHREMVLNSAIHELAHILDRPQLVPDRNVDPVRIQFETLVIANAANSEQSTPASHGHGLSFIRIAVHLVGRANLNGHDVRPAGVIRMRELSPSSIDQYVDVIGPEVEAYIDIRLQDFPEPSNRLLELYQSDTQSQGGIT